MRSPTIAGVEKPAPMSLTCQTSFGPSLGHSLSRPFSSEMPSRLGPRHCGQSVARTIAGVLSKRKMLAEALNKLNGLIDFIGMGFLFISRKWLSECARVVEISEAKLHHESRGKLERKRNSKKHIEQVRRLVLCSG